MSTRASAPTAAPAAPSAIETKMIPGAPRRDVVARPRLLAELERRSDLALTLVAAPVGFGKSVLVQSWCAETDSAIAWVSLDAGDNDPSRLWWYVATSVDRVRSGLGRGALTRLRVPGVPANAVVDELVNGVNAYGRPLAIVLDDLHVVTDEACLESVAHAIEHLPPHVRVLATTRSDPALPLGRLRGRGALGEIRASALAFTVDEARELLVVQERISLDDASVELLVERTEGWPAGLYLAALWLRGLEDPAAGVRDFHGDHRHVADYLTTEVLDTLDPDTRRFLLESSVLGRFNAALCDAVLGRADSSVRLREVERENGFLIPLDARGEWYRYHHLFGELLRLELAHDEPGAATRLHLRASDWCGEHDLTEEALEHASAAGDESRVATILVGEHLQLLRSGRLTTLLRWCAALSDALLFEHPELPLAGALAAGLLGSPTDERRRLMAIAEGVQADAPGRWTAYHEVLHGIAAVTWVEKDLATSIEQAHRAADLARDGVTEGTVPALASLGFLLFLAGRGDEARPVVEEALARPELALRPHGRVFALAIRSLLLGDAGDWDSAEAEARKALAVAHQTGVAGVASGGAARVALAVALAGRGRLREAEREAVEGERLRRYPGPEAAHLHALLVLAAIRAKRGQVARASADLERVRRGLEAFDDSGRLPDLASAVERQLAHAAASAAPPAEAPSIAELNVLELLASELSLREIGASLYLSLNTVKTHTRALYRKLGVSSREEAVVRATALGLIAQDESPG